MSTALPELVLFKAVARVFGPGAFVTSVAVIFSRDWGEGRLAAASAFCPSPLCYTPRGTNLSGGNVPCEGPKLLTQFRFGPMAFGELGQPQIDLTGKLLCGCSCSIDRIPSGNVEPLSEILKGDLAAQIPCKVILNLKSQLLVHDEKAAPEKGFGRGDSASFQPC